MTQAVAATVGMFDGVHRGHGLILEALQGCARAKGLGTRVYTFSLHPLATLRPGSAPGRLTSNAGRRRLLLEAGIDQVRELDFRKVRALAGADFLRALAAEGVEALVMGFNNHIGHDRLTAAQANAAGIMPVEEVRPGAELSAVSSSAIRDALGRADIPAVRAMLGRTYRVSGKVVAGNRLGRTLGFPTANIEIPAERMLPADGVYAVEVSAGGVHLGRGMANIGMRPTVGGTRRTLEVNILDYHGDLYGQTLDIDFLGFLRPERRFGSLEDLALALGADRLAASRFEAE